MIFIWHNIGQHGRFVGRDAAQQVILFHGLPRTDVGASAMSILFIVSHTTSLVIRCMHYISFLSILPIKEGVFRSKMCHLSLNALLAPSQSSNTLWLNECIYLRTVKHIFVKKRALRISCFYSVITLIFSHKRFKDPFQNPASLLGPALSHTPCFSTPAI